MLSRRQPQGFVRRCDEVNYSTWRELLELINDLAIGYLSLRSYLLLGQFSTKVSLWSDAVEAFQDIACGQAKDYGAAVGTGGW
jgi:hypothetical protein